jgi:hypothetical protein
MKKNTSIGMLDFIIAGALAGGSMLAFSFIGPKGGAGMPEDAAGDNALDLFNGDMEAENKGGPSPVRSARLSIERQTFSSS